MKYTLDLTNCKTIGEIYAAIEADLNARKQLGIRRIVRMKLHNLFK